MGKWKELAQPDDIHTCHADCQKPACVAARKVAAGKRETMKPTQEQVTAWAREAGIKSSKSNGMFYTEYWDGVCPDGFVAAMTLAYEAGRKDENEACAKVCESAGPGAGPIYCAAAIRARREQ